jgi:hypothetical protein
MIAASGMALACGCSFGFARVPSSPAGQDAPPTCGSTRALAYTDLGLAVGAGFLGYVGVGAKTAPGCTGNCAIGGITAQHMQIAGAVMLGAAALAAASSIHGFQVTKQCEALQLPVTATDSADSGRLVVARP